MQGGRNALIYLGIAVCFVAPMIWWLTAGDLRPMHPLLLWGGFSLAITGFLMLSEWGHPQMGREDTYMNAGMGQDFRPAERRYFAFKPAALRFGLALVLGVLLSSAFLIFDVGVTGWVWAAGAAGIVYHMVGRWQARTAARRSHGGIRQMRRWSDD